MNALEKLLKETEFTQEELKIYKKVHTNWRLDGLKFLLDLMLEDNDITQEQYNKACDNVGLIQEKYDKWLNYDWQTTMLDAINYVLEGE